MTNLNVPAPEKVKFAPLPCGDSLSITFNLNFTATDVFEMDFTQAIEREQIDSVQSVYINNTNNTGALVITVSGSGQVIDVPAGAIAYLPIFAPNPPRFSVASVLAADQTAQVIFNNFPTPSMIYV